MEVKLAIGKQLPNLNCFKYLPFGLMMEGQKKIVEVDFVVDFAVEVVVDFVEGEEFAFLLSLLNL
jgi:hypothetical protein